MKRICLTFAATLLAIGISVPANAQYIWLDKNNVKHYSDKPPPVEIPNNRILKSPRGNPARNISESSENIVPRGKNGASVSANKAPTTTAEKNADFNKRKIEQAAKDKKTEEEKKRADTKAQNCERAKEYQRTINSGQRISRANKSGEREYLSDEERAKESQTVNEALKDCN